MSGTRNGYAKYATAGHGWDRSRQGDDWQPVCHGHVEASMRYAWIGASLLWVAFLVGAGNDSWASQEPYGDFIAKSPPRTPAEEQKCFHLPPGFEIELVASEPAIGKPINL